MLHKVSSQIDTSRLDTIFNFGTIIYSNVPPIAIIANFNINYLE